MNLSALNRQKYLKEMEKEELDLLIIGGGITGVGIALDAILRGMKVGLVEMQDFAAGTSSRSTKLIHGGLRYLKQLEFKVVAEVGKERAIVYENAPHVTTPEWMMLPFYKGGTFGKLSTSVGLKLYDFLAGVKKEERRKILDKKAALNKEPLIRAENLIGSGIYVEYKTDDARLTIEVIKEAAKYGALISNYAKAEELIYKEGKLKGVRIKDLLLGDEYSVFAKRVVSATGPWVDELREKDKSKHGKHLLLTKGVHIVFDQAKFPLHHAIYFDAPDKRMIFAIPRDGKTYLGTTDTVYEGDLSNPRMTPEDMEYLLKAANYMFPSLNLAKGDIEANWAGIRPLIHEEGKSPSEVSRKDEIFISQTGLISIAGGKLTGYRKMAVRVVDLVAKQLKNEYHLNFPGSQTLNKKLSGGDVGGSEQFGNFVIERVREGINIGLNEKEAKELVNRYGSNVTKIFNRLSNSKSEDLQGLPKTVYASLLYGIEEEMVVSPVDYFNRRTSAMLFNKHWVIMWQEAVINFMANYFNWSETTKSYYVNELDRELKFLN